jgi:cell division protein FtsN
MPLEPRRIKRRRKVKKTVFHFLATGLSRKEMRERKKLLETFLRERKEKNAKAKKKPKKKVKTKPAAKKKVKAKPVAKKKTKGKIIQLPKRKPAAKTKRKTAPVKYGRAA